MKYQWILILIVVLVSQIDAIERAHSRNRRGLNDKLEHFLNNKLRHILRNGNETLGIPILDPLQRDEHSLKFEEEEFLIDLLLKNFNATGASNYVVTDAEIGLFAKKVIIGMTFPLIVSHGSYFIDGQILGRIPVYGEGDYNVYVRDFAFLVEVVFSISGGLSISSMDLQIAVEEVGFVADGMFHDEAVSTILSVLISDMAPSFVSDFHDEITEVAMKKIITFTNDYLKDMSLSELVAIISYF